MPDLFGHVNVILRTGSERHQQHSRRESTQRIHAIRDSASGALVANFAQNKFASVKSIANLTGYR